jgi:hypothetical protein
MRARNKDRILMGTPNEKHVVNSLAQRILMEAEGSVLIARASSQPLPSSRPRPKGALTQPKES